MQLIIDIGNTNIVFGINQEGTWKNVWRIRKDKQKTADEYEVIFRSLFESVKVCQSSIMKVVLSSVVPSLNDDFKELIDRFLGLQVLLVGPDMYSRLPIKILNPYQIGTDLVANATAAYTKFEKPCMVVDFGTALTFLTLSGTGEILGVAIAPGLGTAVRSLAGDTAQLPYVQLAKPPSVLGRNTVHAIQSGVVIGYSGLVDRMIEQTELELQEKLHVVATGGLSGIFAGLVSRITHIEENLTLDGLKIIGDLF
ncbi:type III pantothenate kinase [Sunxiuqinia sp. sy24]|uniref:type III pantothenate kinase n=1 Tax=Sunxiuqinia sp. sy24 TaxID=3461495 RepID=UPI00404616D6